MEWGRVDWPCWHMVSLLAHRLSVNTAHKTAHRGVLAVPLSANPQENIRLLTRENAHKPPHERRKPAQIQAIAYHAAREHGAKLPHKR